MKSSALRHDPAQLSLFDAPVRDPVDPNRVISAQAAPSTGVLAPAIFSHPNAKRQIRLDQHVIGYELRRGRRRSIGFVVGFEGLSVAAPRWVTLAEIDDALREKAAWIVRKLAEQRQRSERRHASRIDWRDGTGVPFLGETVIVVLDPRAAGAVLNTDGAALPGVARLTLHIGLAHGAAGEQIRDAVLGWLQAQARKVFEARCAHYAPLLGVRVKRLALSSAETRWGSANADGSVRLNWRLVHFALPTIDYVVAHELAHLREMNHGPRFWSLVRSVMPDYARARALLSDDALPVFV